MDQIMILVANLHVILILNALNRITTHMGLFIGNSWLSTFVCALSGLIFLGMV